MDFLTLRLRHPPRLLFQLYLELSLSLLQTNIKMRGKAEEARDRMGEGPGKIDLDCDTGAARGDVK